jgi:hypothetical protein
MMPLPGEPDLGGGKRAWILRDCARESAEHPAEDQRSAGAEDDRVLVAVHISLLTSLAPIPIAARYVRAQLAAERGDDGSLHAVDRVPPAEARIRSRNPRVGAHGHRSAQPVDPLRPAISATGVAVGLSVVVADQTE